MLKDHLLIAMLIAAEAFASQEKISAFGANNFAATTTKMLGTYLEWRKLHPE